MPYITMEERGMIDNTKIGVAMKKSGGPGWLGYAIYRLCLNYVGLPLSFSTISAVIGILESIKLELYARIARPYEDSKLESNGDVT